MGADGISEKYLNLPQFITNPGTIKIGELIELDRAEARHATSSRRLKQGQLIRVADGSGTVGVAIIKENERKRVILQIIEGPFYKDDRLPIVFLISLIKIERFEFALSKLSELGIKAVYPVITERTNLKDLSIQWIEKKIKRWMKLSLEALKQSRGFKATEIHAPITLKDALKSLTDSFPQRIFPWEILSKSPNGFDLENTSWPALVVIGPEGGFSESDLELLRYYHFKPFGLGSRILRTETAALVTGAILSHAYSKRRSEI